MCLRGSNHYVKVFRDPSKFIGSVVKRAEIARWLLRITHKVVPRVRTCFKFCDMSLYIPYSVFNPVFTCSTGLLIKNLDPRGVVVEAGSGSGVISIYAALNFNPEMVLGYDINPVAVAASRLNAKMNNANANFRLGSPRIKADYIIVNPPYLPVEPLDDLDLNWCGGSDLRILRKMLKHASKLLRYGGELLTTTSSLTGVDFTASIMRRCGLDPEVSDSRPTPLDRVYVIRGIKF